MLRHAIVTVAVLTAAGVYGQPAGTLPTTVPTTSAAPAADTGVAATTTVFMVALGTADLKGLAQVLAWDDPADRKRVEELGGTPMFNQLQEIKERAELFGTEFPGDDTAKQYVEGLRKTIAQIEDAKAQTPRIVGEMVGKAAITLDGDAAVVEMPGALIKLKKVEGKWLVLPESAGPLVPRNAEERKASTARHARVMKAAETRKSELSLFKQDVKEHKYPTAEEALKVMAEMDARHDKAATDAVLRPEAEK